MRYHQKKKTLQIMDRQGKETRKGINNLFNKIIAQMFPQSLEQKGQLGLQNSRQARTEKKYS
jgi:uncharacterized lipoprotein NlpE involved in copper resistance